MNIRLSLIDAVRRFAAGRRSPRVVEKKTYVFILVPFSFRGNGHARKLSSSKVESRITSTPTTYGLTVLFLRSLPLTVLPAEQPPSEI
jgi:hypothetical protein